MSKKYCNKCGVELTDENWYPSSKKYYSYICKECNKNYTKQWRIHNPEQYMEIVHSYRQRYPNRTRASAIKSLRKRGVPSMSENKKCSLYLGVHIAEHVLKNVFKNVKHMQNGNHGFDFICARGKRVDVKATCLKHRYGNNCGWDFTIRRNMDCDYFLCLAFDNREDLNPLYLWLIPANKINHLMTAGVSLTTIHKWDEYRLDINKVITYCNIIKKIHVESKNTEKKQHH